MLDRGSEERTIAATPRRLAAARRGGHFLHSRDLTSSAAGCAAAVSLWLLGPHLWTSAVDVFAAAWTSPAATMDDVRAAAPTGAATLRIAALLIGILGIPTAAAAIASSMQQGFRPQLRFPQIAWSLLNPFSGWRRMGNGVAPLAIGQLLIKFATVSVIAGLAILRIRQGAAWEAAAGAFGVAGVVGRAVVGCGVLLTAALLLVSIVDWICSRRRFELGLRMTPSEAREEARDSKRRPLPRTRIAGRVSIPGARASASPAEGEDPLPNVHEHPDAPEQIVA